MEEWKDVKGYEGLYEVSNTGKVRSLDRYIRRNKTGKGLIKGRVLKYITDKYGYNVVNLYKDGKMKIHKVHRLVAEAFIPNPSNKPQIDHIDTNKVNNNVDNLRWVTEKENINNPLTLKKKSDVKSKRKVICLETQTVYNSIREAGKIIGVSESVIICCCKGRNLTAKGLHWKYYE